MGKQYKIYNIILLVLISILLSSCQSSESITTETINKNISIDAKIAAIDAYGNITLNILTKNIIDADFDLSKKLFLQFSNGYLAESFLTSTNKNIDCGICYATAIGEDNPISIGIKEENLAKIGTLKIGDTVKIYQISTT